MKKTILLITLSLSILSLMAQKPTIYHPEANATADIEAAIQKAKAEHKYVLLQGGGNWCKWCIEFHSVCTTDKHLDSLINENFVWYHLNYSKENKNLDILKQYDYPQRFGFPVFIILNENGERIHTQNSEYLEDGDKSYDKKKVAEFLKAWSPSALDPMRFEK
jgi:thioredoxin-related protein